MVQSPLKKNTRVINCDMPIPIRYRAEFFEGQYFHVFNRTNNKEILFLSDENRTFFLTQFEKHLSAGVDAICWALLNNHFHLFLRVKSQGAIVDSLSQMKTRHSLDQRRYLAGEVSVNILLQQSFKRFFQSYAQAFNKQHNRSGNLFRRPFRRVAILNDSYFTKIIVYIHTNPWKHRVFEDFTKYKWSSYESFVKGSGLNAVEQEVIDWFGGTDNFINVHLNATPIYKNLGL